MNTVSRGKENFLFSSENDLTRKRKFSSNGSFSLQIGSPITWDVGCKITNEILQDMGVGALGDDSNDGPASYSKFKNESPMSKIPKLCLSNSPIITEDSNKKNEKCPFSKLSDEIVLHILKWLPKVSLCRCALVCKKLKQLAYDDSLWKRMDLGHKVIKPGVLAGLVSRGVIVLRLALSEVMTPFFLDCSEILKMQANRLSKLQYLDLSMAVISVVTLRDLLSTCRQLKNLSLEQCTVNDDVCKELAENPDLVVLNMSMVKGLSSKGLSVILKNCLSLKELNLAWTHLDADSLNTLTEYLGKNIQRLNISGCRNTLTDKHVSQIIQCCPEIKELDLSDATVLTDIALKAILSIKIIHLHLSRCYNIPPAQFLHLTNHKTLKNLDVFGLFTEQFLTRFKTTNPNIEVNKHLFSSIARPTVGIRRTSIWGHRVRE